MQVYDFMYCGDFLAVGMMLGGAIVVLVSMALMRWHQRRQRRRANGYDYEHAGH